MAKENFQASTSFIAMTLLHEINNTIPGVTPLVTYTAIFIPQTPRRQRLSNGLVKGVH